MDLKKFSYPEMKLKLHQPDLCTRRNVETLYDLFLYTISSRTSNNMKELISKLEIESKIATQCFRDNSVIVNPENFRAIIIDRKNQNNNPQINYS